MSQDIEFSYSPPTRSLAEADPPHPGGIIGRWPDGFLAVIPQSRAMLEDPGLRPLLIERFEEVRASAEKESTDSREVSRDQ